MGFTLENWLRIVGSKRAGQAGGQKRSSCLQLNLRSAERRYLRTGGFDLVGVKPFVQRWRCRTESLHTNAQSLRAADRPSNGSSSRIRLGGAISARAIATIWRSPPDRFSARALHHPEVGRQAPALGHERDAAPVDRIRGQAVDGLVLELYATMRQRQDAGYGLEQRGLAHIVASKQRHHLAAPDRQADLVQDLAAVLTGAGLTAARRARSVPAPWLSRAPRRPIYPGRPQSLPDCLPPRPACRRRSATPGAVRRCGRTRPAHVLCSISSTA